MSDSVMFDSWCRTSHYSYTDVNTAGIEQYMIWHLHNQYEEFDYPRGLFVGGLICKMKILHGGLGVIQLLHNG